MSTPPVPWGLLIHSASVRTPTLGTSKGMDIVSSTTATTTACKVQDDGGSEAMIEKRLSGARIASAWFPPDFAIRSGIELTVTGDGFPTAGQIYRVVSPPQNVAGMGCLNKVDLEAVGEV